MTLINNAFPCTSLIILCDVAFHKRKFN